MVIGLQEKDAISSQKRCFLRYHFEKYHFRRCSYIVLYNGMIAAALKSLSISGRLPGNLQKRKRCRRSRNSKKNKNKNRRKKKWKSKKVK